MTEQKHPDSAGWWWCWRTAFKQWEPISVYRAEDGALRISRITRDVLTVPIEQWGDKIEMPTRRPE
jgi:hypothetical protein